MRLAILALLFGVAFGANLDISDNISPQNTNAEATNQAQNQANQATNPSTNQPVNPAQNSNANVNQNANPSVANQANQTQNATNANNAQNNANNANVAQPQQPQQAQVAQPQAQPQAQVPQTAPASQPKPQKVAKPRPSDPDERLKEDIVNFEREQYFQNNANVDDPFIYVYPQTEDEVAMRNQLEQAVLTLKSIIIAPDSNNGKIKRYKAHINNKWVEECRMVKRSRECDLVEGWEVASITEDSVKLRVTRYNMKRDLQLMNKKVTIKKADNYK